MCMYSLVVLLNLNILMSSERLRYPGNVLFCSEKKWELCDVDDDIKLSLYMTFFLGIFNLIGYFVIVGFLGLTEIPLMIRQTRRHAAKALCDPRISPSDYTDPSAFKIGCVFLIFVAFFVAIHLFNFKKNVPLYTVMFIISLLWFFKNFRDFVVVPYNFPLQCFTIIYDLCVTKAFLRNHLILAVFSILGFQDNQWFTIMLFDIFNNSVMLQDIVKSITQPAAQVRNSSRNIFSVHYYSSDAFIVYPYPPFQQLALVLYTIVITCVVFATFGFRKFGAPAFAVGDDHGDDVTEDDYICNSTFTCFWYIFFVGVPAGTISDLMTEVTVYDGEEYWSRVAYDLIFFVWMGVLLFNVITGLMVDTFGALREESNERENTLSNSCFICGVS